MTCLSLCSLGLKSGLNGLLCSQPNSESAAVGASFWLCCWSDSLPVNSVCLTRSWSFCTPCCHCIAFELFFVLHCVVLFGLQEDVCKDACSSLNFSLSSLAQFGVQFLLVVQFKGKDWTLLTGNRLLYALIFSVVLPDLLHVFSYIVTLNCFNLVWQVVWATGLIVKVKTWNRKC